MIAFASWIAAAPRRQDKPLQGRGKSQPRCIRTAPTDPPEATLSMLPSALTRPSVFQHNSGAQAYILASEVNRNAEELLTHRTDLSNELHPLLLERLESPCAGRGQPHTPVPPPPRRGSILNDTPWQVTPRSRRKPLLCA